MQESEAKEKREVEQLEELFLNRLPITCRRLLQRQWLQYDEYNDKYSDEYSGGGHDGGDSVYSSAVTVV